MLGVISESDLSPTEEGDSNKLKRKKARTAFSNEQLAYLENRYRCQRYLAASERNVLARQLGLKDQQVCFTDTQMIYYQKIELKYVYFHETTILIIIIHIFFYSRLKPGFKIVA